MTAAQLWELFAAAYLSPAEPLVVMHEWQASSAGDGTDELKVDLTIRGERATHRATGAGPVDALTLILSAAGLPVDVLGLTQQSLAPGARRGRSPTWSTAAGAASPGRREPGPRCWRRASPRWSPPQGGARTRGR